MSSRPDGPRSPKKNDSSPSEKTEEVGKSSGPFDVRTVKALVSLMTQHDLSEIDLREGNQRLRLRRGYQPGAPQAAASSAPAPVQVAAASAPRIDAAPPPPQASSRRLIDIKSPTIGTFYSSPKPGEPPFVKAGSKVSPETVVCLIEAMKIFNEIQAECSGIIAEVLVENQQAVEYNQVLFRVDPTG